MKIFEHANRTQGWVCPICKTEEDKPVTLIPISGTQEGNLMQAQQFHVDCLHLTWHKSTSAEEGADMIIMLWDTQPQE